MKPVPLMLLLAATLLGCSGNSGDGHEHAAGAQDEHAMQHGELMLNEGEKWVMDDHTRHMIAEIHSTVDDAQVTSLEDAHAMGDTLQAQVNRLVQGCTMEGPAHDQLHVFLSQFIPATGSMTTATSAEAARDSLQRVQDLLSEYDRAFR